MDMKNLLYLIFLATFSLTACTGAAQKESTRNESSSVSYTIVSASEFKTALEKEENAQLIDVRTAGEFAAGSINGAKNYDFLNGTFQEKMATLDKTKPVYVFCAVGGRSGKASTLLKKNGFTKIIDLKGGYNAWPK